MLTTRTSNAAANRREHLLRGGVCAFASIPMPELGSTQQSLCVEPNKWGYDRG